MYTAMKLIALLFVSDSPDTRTRGSMIWEGQVEKLIFFFLLINHQE